MNQNNYSGTKPRSTDHLHFTEAFKFLGAKTLSKTFLALALKWGNDSSSLWFHNRSCSLRPSASKLGNICLIQWRLCRFSESSVYMRSRQFWSTVQDISFRFESGKYCVHTSTTIVVIFGEGWYSLADSSELKLIVLVARALLIGLQYESWGIPIPGFSERARSHTARTNPACTHPTWVNAGS